MLDNRIARTSASRLQSPHSIGRSQVTDALGAPPVHARPQQAPRRDASVRHADATSSAARPTCRSRRVTSTAHRAPAPSPQRIMPAERRSERRSGRTVAERRPCSCETALRGCRASLSGLWTSMRQPAEGFSCGREVVRDAGPRSPQRHRKPLRGLQSPSGSSLRSEGPLRAFLEPRVRCSVDSNRAQVRGMRGKNSQPTPSPRSELGPNAFEDRRGRVLGDC